MELRPNCWIPLEAERERERKKPLVCRRGQKTNRFLFLFFHGMVRAPASSSDLRPAWRQRRGGKPCGGPLHDPHSRLNGGQTTDDGRQLTKTRWRGLYAVIQHHRICNTT